MTKKILRTRMVLAAVASSFVLMTACTQKRQEQSQLPGGNPNPTAPANKAAGYSYPHTPNWKTEHVDFYSKYGQGVQGTDHDCAKCHNDKSNNLGSPKNLSCAIQCHAPVKTPDGSTPVSKPSIGDGGKACLECHKANFTRQKQHYPAAAGLCLNCHTVNPSHATDKSKKSVTTNKSNSSCISCHGKMDTHSEVHKAVTMNDSSCIYCHDAHGSNYNYFTKDKLPDLCLDCHSDIIDDNAKSVHGIITGTEDNKKSCANCHNPHSADIKPLLKKEKKELCLSCHDREYQTKYADGSARTIPNIKLKIKGPGVHPIAKNEANCTMCHSPHASLYSAILTKKYPVTPYEKYTPKKDKIPNSYELCFTCHEEGMLKPDIAEEDTDFRNDVKGADGKIVRENLHWFHVVNAAGSPEPEKGRSCFVCHDPHGSDQKHMIKTAFRLNGTTNVNVSYTATKIGGECANTCHSDPIKRYNRAQ